MARGVGLRKEGREGRRKGRKNGFEEEWAEEEAFWLTMIEDIGLREKERKRERRWK